MARAPLILLAAGGTGGHVFPAEALAETLLDRGFRLALATDDRGGAFGGALATVSRHRVSASNLSGGLVDKTRGLWHLGRGVIGARLLLSRLGPAAIVGFGGYPSVPTMIAARSGPCPTLIHEQNAVIGRANAFLAGRVGAIATAFANVAGIRGVDAAKVTHTGNPVRTAIAAVGRDGYTAPDGGALRLLITGGSQGARVMSHAVPAAIARLDAGLRARLAIVQQCRREDLAAVRAAYEEIGVTADLACFFDDMAARLRTAHLVICRAGASTVAELLAAGRPALMIPYRHATDDHQTANAAAVVAAGAGWMIAEGAFDADAGDADPLAALLSRLAAEPAALGAAAAAAHAAAMPDAARRLADLVELVIRRGNGGALGRAPVERAA
jgi:UDP-N-acetylglucosamine--N-acetylmuramyl-(pentapeptide) pyrophosphoryl-undecaprenol N-acetylglucosamine transferase